MNEDMVGTEKVAEAIWISIKDLIPIELQQSFAKKIIGLYSVYEMYDDDANLLWIDSLDKH